MTGEALSKPPRERERAWWRRQPLKVEATYMNIYLNIWHTNLQERRWQQGSYGEERSTAYWSGMMSCLYGELTKTPFVADTRHLPAAVQNVAWSTDRFYKTARSSCSWEIGACNDVCVCFFTSACSLKTNPIVSSVKAQWRWHRVYENIVWSCFIPHCVGQHHPSVPFTAPAHI